MRVVEWQPRHRDRIARVLGTPDALCSQARPWFGPAVGGPCWRFTLIAEVGGDPVGGAVAVSPRWHPHRLWVSVEVAAGQRRQGIGTALLEAVTERCLSDGRPLRGKVFAGSGGARFAAARGFEMIQRSRAFRLAGGQATTGGGFTVESPADPVDAATAFRDFYLSSHDWDPAGPITIDDIRQSHLAEAAYTIVVRSPAGQALAVGCLYPEDEGLTLSGGPTDPTDSRADEAVTALLDAAPKPVLVEADDSVPTILAALMARGGTVVDEVHVVARSLSFGRGLAEVP